MGYHGRFAQRKQPENRRSREKAGNGTKVLLIVLAVLLVLILAGLGVVYWFIQNKFSKMNIVTLPEDTYAYTQATGEFTRPPETQPVQTEETTAETTLETTRPPMSAEDIVNILVVGQAARDGESGKMADTTMLVSINTYTEEVTVFSILRDSLVNLPAYKGLKGGKNKFTMCYALGYQQNGTAGAMEMTNICLKDNFGIEVDYNVEVSFDGFIRMIDYLNGVELELTEAEANYLNKDTLYVQRTIEPGVQVLQGMEALSYARMRKAAGDGESDIKRTARQRKLVASLLEKFRYMSLSELNGWIDELLPMVTTTMTPSDVTKLAAKILPMVRNLKMQGETIPVGKTGWGEMYDIYGDGNLHSVMLFVSSQQKQLIRAITEAEGN
ncbi:MAG: LCP family protein [Clostridiales bacterium]|nr:LCP family protein [Clostridiales bacterium]